MQLVISAFPTESLSIDDVTRADQIRTRANKLRDAIVKILTACPGCGVYTTLDPDLRPESADDHSVVFTVTLASDLTTRQLQAIQGIGDLLDTIGWMFGHWIETKIIQ